MKGVEPITRLVSALSALPGVGEKTASRLALYVMNSSDAYVRELADSLIGAKDDVTLCSVCMGFSETDPCAICSELSRDHSLICVVSDFKDMAAIEGTGSYNGLYHILHGALSPLKGVGPDEIKIKELLMRLSSGTVSELLIATGFDVEGEATANYIAKLTKPIGLTITRIASGVPVGSFIEYMDKNTLERALSGRREM